MQYFRLDLWQDINSESDAERKAADIQWDENLEKYTKRFEKLSRRLSKSVVNFYKTSSLHDYKLEDIQINHELKKYKYLVNVNIVLNNGISKLALKYRNVKKIEMNYNDAQFDRGFDDVGYEEILDVDERILSHEILFASGATILIHFENKKMSLEKIQY
jgi:hypothetical protein